MQRSVEAVASAPALTTGNTTTPGRPEAFDTGVNRWLWSWARTAAVPSGPLVLAAGRAPPRPVAPIRKAALAGRLALRGVGDGMVMVALGNLIGVSPPCLDGRLGRLGRDQAVAAVPDQVAPTRLEQGL